MVLVAKPKGEAMMLDGGINFVAEIGIIPDRYEKGSNRMHYFSFFFLLRTVSRARTKQAGRTSVQKATPRKAPNRGF